ncbi:hypothetical protein Pcinc_027060 [Petrolisthes cinctipes]|uniref:DUF4604 domain-containing protein n=1 Tax=Petrolisthes cinctipes TaxID=88211 RepID=A0AAE1KBD8_PETCI|nr:hypothetical protein Pcinc_027060 [Petrolisthes cinctipes]
MAGWTGKRGNVSFSKPAEPAFLTRFKQQVGYKEDHGLSDKFAKMPEATDDDVADKEDELPQVVSLRSGDLTHEELESLRKDGKLDDLLKGEQKEEVQGCRERNDDDPPPDGKILFRKPEKRATEGSGEGGKKNSKKLKVRAEKSDDNKLIKKDKKKAAQEIKLLSFNEDEEEEED